MFCAYVYRSVRRLFGTCHHPPYSTQDNHLTRHTFTMDRVFYIEELVQRIALNADDGSVGSASLLALACCCKALEDPVMDILWQRQNILYNIVQTLPVDCWAVTDKVYVSG